MFFFRSEFRNNLRDEVLYGFIRVDDRFILITWVSEQVSGVRRGNTMCITFSPPKKNKKSELFFFFLM